MKSLESLHLAGCSSLKSFPEMPCNIESFILDETAIEDLPSTIEHLSRLVVLNLNRCSRLRSLPNSICKFKYLQHLGLSGCSKLDKLPDYIGALEALRVLEVEGTAMREVAPSIISLNNLHMLSIRRCKVQDTMGLLLPPFLGLHGLRELDLTDCGIIKLLESLGCSFSVEILHLAINDFESLLASIINLSNLRYLDLSYCKRLQYLLELPLVSINAYNCTSLQVLSCLSNPDTVVTKDYLLIQFDFTNCFKLGQDVLRDSVKDALLKIQRMATLWKEKYIHKDLDAPPLDTIICFPGSEVPELFSFRSMESVITVELPTDWFNDNFVGFALCAIVEFQDHKIDVQDLKIFCKCKLKSGDEYEDVCAGTLDAFADSCHGTRYIGSDDLVSMGFDNRMYPRDVGAIMRHLSSSILALTIMENVEKIASSKSVGCV